MPVTIEVRSLIELLRGILSDLNKLDDGQLQALINKEAKFKYIDNKPKSGKTPSITQADIEEIKVFLNKCEDIEEAKSYFEGQKKFTVPKLQDIAKQIGAHSSSKKKADIIKSLLEVTVVARLRYESIQRT
jgi:hypothetical protein